MNNTISKVQPYQVSLQTVPMEDIPTHIRVCEQNIRLNGWMLGALLLEAKSRCAHGEFGKWLDTNTDISHTTANELMKLATACQDQPFLSEMKQSAAIALLALPAEDREQFAADHPVEEMSVRQLKEAIRQAEDEKKRAIAMEEQNKRLTENYNAAMDQFTKLGEAMDADKAEIKRLQKELDSKPITVEVPVEVVKEVAPADYDRIKSDLAAAEDYAVEMEKKAREAQAELRRVRDRAGDADECGNDADGFQKAVSDFIGKVALLPKMGAALDRSRLSSYEAGVQLIRSWVLDMQNALMAVDDLSATGYHVR